MPDPSRRRDRPPPTTGPSEMEVLTGFLDYLRQSALAKVADAPEERVRAPGVPSGTNLLGLIEHLTHVERRLFLGKQPHDWASTFRADPGKSTEGVLRGYRAAIVAANQVIAGCADIEGPAHSGESAPSMRWALVHMIEETGRHAGHLDILRELIDGSTGR